MTTDISSEGLTVLETGALKNGAPYNLVLLTAAQAQQAASFHHAIIDDLALHEKTFMLPKTPAYFSHHLEKDGGNIIMAIISNGHVIAQSMVHHPTIREPDDGMVDLNLTLPFNKKSLFQAVAVSPAYRNQGLVSIMVAHWLAQAQRHGKTHLLAEIDVRNAPSWGNFLKARMALVGIGVDSSDGTLVYNAHGILADVLKKRSASAFNAAAQKGYVCPANDIGKQKGLFSSGYVCTGYSKNPAALTFEQNAL